MLKYSIIIPVKEINEYVLESILHILDLNYLEYEIIVLPNKMPKKNVSSILKEARIISTGKVSPATKRDIGAKNAKGDILAFLDDDSYPKGDWLTIADRIFKTKDVAAINGPAITPLNATIKEKISGAFFESSIGGGAAHRCKDIGKSFEIDDAPSVNLLIRRDIFLKVGGFGSLYWPGEDSLFCQKLKDAGHKIWYQNDLIVYHHRRDSFKEHLKQVAGYGIHRGNFYRKGIGCSRKLSYLIPSLFLIGNLLLFFIWPNLFMLMLLIYFVVMFFNFCLNLNLSALSLSAVMVLTYVSHLTYGFYFIVGFFTKDIRSKLR